VSAAFLDAGAGSSVVVEDARVSHVGVGLKAPAGVRTVKVAAGDVVEPGAVNAHTHLYSGLAPMGLPAPWPPPANFVQILERVWWLLDRALDEETLRASARFYMAEALLSGTTALIDHHESPWFIRGSLDVLADAAQELGIRLVTGYGATERNRGRDEGQRGLEECRRFVRANRRPLVRGFVALHASFTVSDDTIREAAALTRELDVPMHVHVAEDAADVADARRRGFAGPLERLMTLGALPAQSVAAHGVHLNAEQVRRADGKGVWLVHNPRSNAGNRVGYARDLSSSLHVALGTDGYNADMPAERAALLEQSLLAGEQLDAETREARFHGGYAMLSQRFGMRFSPTVAPGMAADVVVRNAQGNVRHVMVAGRVVVEDGRLLTGDMQAIKTQAAQQATRLWGRLAAVRGAE
jgi:cytosine/adenosine deaminase-related metal-dependent hydrolase